MKRITIILATVTLMNLVILGIGGAFYYWAATYQYTDPLLDVKMEGQYYRGWADNCIAFGVNVFNVSQNEAEGVCYKSLVTLKDRDWYHTSDWTRNWQWPINDGVGDAASEGS